MGVSLYLIKLSGGLRGLLDFYSRTNNDLANLHTHNVSYIKFFVNVKYDIANVAIDHCEISPTLNIITCYNSIKIM